MLVSKEELHRMRFLALRKRCAIIEETHGLKISCSTLVRIYHRNDVRCRQAKTERRLTLHRQAALDKERVMFARKLLAHIQAKQKSKRLIYADETTFQLWNKP